MDFEIAVYLLNASHIEKVQSEVKTGAVSARYSRYVSNIMGLYQKSIPLKELGQIDTYGLILPGTIPQQIVARCSEFSLVEYTLTVEDIIRIQELCKSKLSRYHMSDTHSAEDHPLLPGVCAQCGYADPKATIPNLGNKTARGYIARTKLDFENLLSNMQMNCCNDIVWYSPLWIGTCKVIGIPMKE